MRGATLFTVIAILTAATVGLVSVIPLGQSDNVSHPSFSLQFVRNGGIAGAHDVLLIDESGRVSYTSRFGPSFNASLSQHDLSSLRETLATGISAIQTTSIHPKGGAADFFSYDLTVTIGNKTTTLSWIDQWASSDPLPAGLHDIHLALQSMIQSFLAGTA
jgi:hypothetical protein